MTEKRILALILGLFIVLGIVYALVTPVFEASDELWHYPMIRHLADGNPLPVQVFDPAQAGPWNQEASQPPLYYYLGAALTFWIDSGDVEQIRWLNPHVDNGLITADGNINLTIHDPAANPWQGTLLAVRIVRIFSVFLGAATVYLTYLIGREVAPNRPEIALGAAAINAFMPMFLFISGAVNNDNLAVPLASLALLLMIRLVNRQRANLFAQSQSSLIIHYLLLGVVIGLAVLTKEGTIGLLPLAWGAAFMASGEQRGTDGRQFWLQFGRLLLRSLLNFVIVLLPVLLIAGWWYWRNIVLYGDWLGWNAFIAVLGQRSQAASLAQLWDERWGFMMSYWGLFGGVNVPMWTWIYHLLNAVLLIGVAGFAVYLQRQVRAWHLDIGHFRWDVPALIANLLYFVETRFALVASLLLATAVILGLVRWATTTWSSQGRLAFTAVSALSVLLATGLAGWLPPRWARWVMGGLGGFMAVIAAIAPWVWIRPAYRPETYLPDPPAVFQPQSLDFGGRMRLSGFTVEPTAVSPGDWVDVQVQWDVLQPMPRDWSVFVHLTDPVLGVPIAQRDMYTGQGLRPTSLLQPGERLVNYYRLRVPETAVAPADLQLTVGLYDFYDPNQARLLLENGDDAAVLATVDLTTVPGPLPNPTAINFGDELELVGFDVSPRRVGPGQTVELTLYWQAKRPLAANYTLFAQIVDEDTTRWAAIDLSPPAGTAAWTPGAVQAVAMPLTLAADTPARVYPLIVGAYTRAADGGFQKLQLVTEDGRITQDDLLTLTKIRVD